MAEHAVAADFGAATDAEPARMAAVRRYEILDTSPDRSFERVCALAARCFRVPMASVAIVDVDRIWFKARVGLPATEIARDHGFAASAILQDHPYVVADALRDPRAAATRLVHGEPGVRFYAAAPITTPDGHRLGAVEVMDPHPREVTDDELATLRDLAAILIDELELRLAAREAQRQRDRGDQAVEDKWRAQRLARTLQQTLAPSRLPRVPGLDVAGHYQPFAAEDVGGEFYEVFPLARERWGFFLGDVCGKGPEAAALTSQVRYTLRAAAVLGEGPADALAELNTALLLEQDDTLQLCTAVHGELEQAPEGFFAASLAVAGHPPPLIIRSSGDVEMVPTGGPLLGAVADASFTTSTICLDRHDAVVLYSDGVLDVGRVGEHLSPEGLADMLAGTPVRTAAEVVRRVLGLVRVRDRPLRDDAAILAFSVS